MSQRISVISGWFHTPTTNSINLSQAHQITESNDLLIPTCIRCNTALKKCLRSQIDHDQEINENTWAISALILIHLPEKPLERPLTIPELYLPKKTL